MSDVNVEHWSLKKKNSGKVYKQITLDSLKKWILEARIDADDYLTNQTLGKWVKASSIEELSSFFSPDAMGSEVISSGDMGLFWQSNSVEELELELTPMIDVTFLLLIFFMVTATFAIHEVKSVTVPKAKYTQKYKQEKLSISLDKDRRIFIGRTEVSLKSLKNLLMQKVEQTKQQDVVLAADQSLNYGFITAVLDEINGAGIKNVKLKLEKKKN